MDIQKKYDLIMISTCIDHKYVYKFLESLECNKFINNFIVIVNQSKENIEVNRNIFNNVVVINHGKKVNSSLARNFGIEYIIKNKIVSNYVCYPDDDSSFDESFFIKLKEWINIKETRCFITDLYCSDKEGLFREVNLSNYSKLSKSSFNIVGAVNILISYEVFKKIGKYDERFGVNALYGAGEDGDYFLRGLECSEFLYTKDIFSFHPSGYDKFKELSYKEKRKKLNNYGKGVIALLNKHRMYKESVIIVFRAIGGFLFSFKKFQFSLGLAYLEAFFVRLFYLIFFLIKPVKYEYSCFNSNI